MDKIPVLNPSQSIVTTIESTANFEGNNTLVLLERVKNPEIKKQIVNLLHEGARQLVLEQYKLSSVDGGYISEHAWLKDQILPKEEIEAKVKSISEIERELDERTAGAAIKTDISSANRPPNMKRISLNWVKKDGTKPNKKEMSIIEAHEKGHQIRPYWSDFFSTYFRQGFDLSKVIYTQDDYEEDIRNIQLTHPDSSIEETRVRHPYAAMRESFTPGVFIGYEIAERMSQLKNYFGMKGDEKFTKEHLEYARIHYIKDTNVDNHMTHFFAAITPATTEAFLRIINSAGI